MALRELRTEGDPILRKISKPVKEITPRIKEIVKDMFETMEEENGVGLAAVQVGILKRIFVIDLEVDGENIYQEFINPEIISIDEIQVGVEGCLSVPNEYGLVARPNKVRVRALNLDGEVFEVELKELGARAICHENDHLNGKLYIDVADIMTDEISELKELGKFEEYCEKYKEELN